MPQSTETLRSQVLPAVLVTGAGRRIGRAIAENLAGSGHAVALHCNESRKETDEVAAGIAERGGSAVVVQADLTDRFALGGLMQQAADRLDRPIELLVNNASLFTDDEIDDFEWPSWDRHFAVHLDAPVMLARKLAGQLPAGQDGLVVNIIDQRVLKPTPHHFSYALSKGALWQATRVMAQALAPRVRVNAIGPGPTLKNFRQTDADFERQAQSVLLGHGPQLSEFGATIRYLWQAKSVTGQMIAIDGGQHLAWQTPDTLEDGR